jgi:plastocyanin
MTASQRWAASRQIVPTRLFVVGVFSAALACLDSYSSPAGHVPPANIVVIEGVSFKPEVLTVKRGDWVQWINKDPFPHTVNSAGTFDSRSVAAGATWKYHASKVGTFEYTCALHPNMKGTLRVE